MCALTWTLHEQVFASMSKGVDGDEGYLHIHRMAGSHYDGSLVWKRRSTGGGAGQDLEGPSLYSMLMHLEFSLKQGEGC